MLALAALLTLASKPTLYMGSHPRQGFSVQPVGDWKPLTPPTLAGSKLWLKNGAFRAGKQDTLEVGVVLYEKTYFADRQWKLNHQPSSGRLPNGDWVTLKVGGLTWQIWTYYPRKALPKTPVTYLIASALFDGRELVVHASVYGAQKERILRDALRMALSVKPFSGTRP